MGALAFRDSFGGVEFRTPRPPSMGTVLASTSTSSFLLRYDLFIYVTLKFNIENDENDTFIKSGQ